MVKGGMCDEGGMCGKGGCAWRRGGMHGMHPAHEIQPVIARAVRILLECILVINCVHVTRNPTTTQDK